MLLTGDELIAFYKDMIAKYPTGIVTIEDLFDQDDWNNWTNFCELEMILPLPTHQDH